MGRERLVTPAFVALAAVDLAYFTANGIILYALPLQVTGPLGSDEAGSGLAFGVFAFTALLLRPVAGRLVDVWGRRWLIAGGAALAGVTMAAMAFAGSLPEVIALRVLMGVAEAAVFVAGIAMLADIAPASRFGEAMSYNSLGLFLGLAIGPPLGEWLVGPGDFRAAWLGAAVLATAAGALALALPETWTGAAGDVPRTLIHRRAIPAALGFLAAVIALGGFLSLAALRAVSVGLETASTPLYLYGAIVFGCRLAFAKVPDRVSPVLLGAASLLAITAGLGVAAVSATPAGLIGGTALLAVGIAFGSPAFFSVIFATAGPSQRGAASATGSIALDLGLGVGPILLGFVARVSDTGVALLLGAVVALLGAFWTLTLPRGPAPSA